MLHITQFQFHHYLGQKVWTVNLVSLAKQGDEWQAIRPSLFKYFHSVLRRPVSFCLSFIFLLLLYDTARPFSQCYAQPDFLIAFQTHAYYVYNPQAVLEYLPWPSS